MAFKLAGQAAMPATSILASLRLSYAGIGLALPATDP
jgi:hypothetical protein